MKRLVTGKGVQNAVALLDSLLQVLRANGVRSFKGDLLAKDGTRVWTVDFAFDREPTKPGALQRLGPREE